MNASRKNGVMTAVSISLISLSACQVTVPATDNVSPRLAIAIEDGGLKFANSTDPSTALSIGCPTGTSTTIQAVSTYHAANYMGEFVMTQDYVDNAYYYRATAKPFKLSILSADDGGTGRVAASFYDRTISLNNADGSSGIANITPISAVKLPTIVASNRDSLAVNHDTLPSDARNLETLIFIIDDFVEGPILSAYAEDFHGNKQAISARFFPVSLCQ